MRVRISPFQLDGRQLLQALRFFGKLLRQFVAPWGSSFAASRSHLTGRGSLLFRATGPSKVCCLPATSRQAACQPRGKVLGESFTILRPLHWRLRALREARLGRPEGGTAVPGLHACPLGLVSSRRLKGKSHPRKIKRVSVRFVFQMALGTDVTVRKLENPMGPPRGPLLLPMGLA